MSRDEDQYVPGPPEDEKLCQKCGKWKPVTEFYKRGKKSKYYAGYCKACHSEPFKYEKISCPHCKKPICFYGVGEEGKVIQNKKTKLISSLKKEVRRDLLRKKKPTRPKQQPVLVKDILNGQEET